MTDEPLAPDILERLLLQAGLEEPDRAIGAWKEFCEQVGDVEALGNSCYDLFPMVAINLESFASTLTHGDYLQSVLKHSWARSKRMLSIGLPILAALQSEGLDFLVLKSLALSPLYYKHWGNRPLKDMGVLIHADDLERATQILRRMDFLLQRGVLPDAGKKAFELDSKMVWEHSTKIELHLQWRFTPRRCNRHAEESVWNRAVPCPLPGLEARTLGATETFFHTSVYRRGLNPCEIFPELADAAIILRRGEIDWTYLDELSGSFQQIEPVRDTITRLGELKMGVPDSILARWRKRKASPLENLEKACHAQPMIRRWKIKVSALTYLCVNQGASLGVLCRNIGAYVRQLDDVKGVLRRIAVILYVVRWNRLRNASMA